MNPEEMLAACGEVRAEAISAFACLAARGFRLAEHAGFYPRVRADREGTWFLGIDFWMTLDERGQYRTEWKRQTPFELSGIASITRQEGAELIRYRKPHVLYAARPYDLALQTLEADLTSVAQVIESWSDETIIGTGERGTIRRTWST
jgi:hypothetical protein